MISVFPLSQSNMLGFTLDGEVDQDGLRKLMTALEAKTATHGKVRLLGNIKNVSGGFDSFKSFWKTMSAKTELWNMIEKYAILTDYGFVSTLVSGFDWLSTRMEVKTFPLSAGETAHAWLKVDPAVPKADNVNKVDLGTDTQLGLAVTGALNVADYDRINVWVEEQVQKYGSAKIFLEIVSLEGITVRSFYEDLTSSIKLYGSIERMAIVGDQSYLKSATKIADLVTPGLELAGFSTTERQRALAWLD